MKYLDAVIRESLRLYPSVPFFSRKLEAQLDLSKYNIWMYKYSSIIIIQLILFFYFKLHLKFELVDFECEFGFFKLIGSEKMRIF